MAELVYGARLESVYTPQAYLGFESLSLRQILVDQVDQFLLEIILNI